MLTCNVKSSVGETELVSDSLDFLLLHFLGDGGSEVLWAVFGFFLQLLQLNFGKFFGKPITVNFKSGTYSFSVRIV
jgi:hypothetical protein